MSPLLSSSGGIRRRRTRPRVNSYFALSGRLRLIIWEKILANEHIKNMVPEINKRLTLNAERKVT
jgi:hypothetical protein